MCPHSNPRYLKLKVRPKVALVVARMLFSWDIEMWKIHSFIMGEMEMRGSGKFDHLWKERSFQLKMLWYSSDNLNCLWTKFQLWKTLFTMMGSHPVIVWNPHKIAVNSEERPSGPNHCHIRNQCGRFRITHYFSAEKPLNSWCLFLVRELFESHQCWQMKRIIT